MSIDEIETQTSQQLAFANEPCVFQRQYCDTRALMFLYVHTEPQPSLKSSPGKACRYPGTQQEAHNAAVLNGIEIHSAH
jgi:hypothetical protein